MNQNLFLWLILSKWMKIHFSVICVCGKDFLKGFIHSFKSPLPPNLRKISRIEQVWLVLISSSLFPCRPTERMQMTVKLSPVGQGEEEKESWTDCYIFDSYNGCLLPHNILRGSVITWKSKTIFSFQENYCSKHIFLDSYVLYGTWWLG